MNRAENSNVKVVPILERYIEGYHRVYNPTMNREEFGRHVVETIKAKLKEVFPQA